MSPNEYFCVKCDEIRTSEQKMTTIVHSIKGEEISVEVLLPYCNTCGSQLSDLDIEEKHFDMALDEYRKRKNLLYSQDIKAIREKYGLSQRAFARALGVAEPTINRYEQGAIQDVVHNNLILLVDQPDNMIMMALQNKKNLSEKEFETIQENAKCIKEKLAIKQELLDNIEELLAKHMTKISKDISDLAVIANNSSQKVNELDCKFGAYLKDFKNHCKQTNLTQRSSDWDFILKAKEAGFPMSTKSVYGLEYINTSLGINQ